MPKNPMVSIVIPVYNGSNYVREAIDSALGQDYDSFEVIVVNDGSTDGGATERIARSYGDKIRYFSKPNGGVATALNLALGQMRGEYFSWLSHDDIYYPNKVRVEIEALRDCGDWTRIVYCNYDFCDAQGRTTQHACVSSGYPRSLLENSVFPILYVLINGCSLLIHKSHFERVGLFKPELLTTQDYDLWFRMFRHQRLVYVPQCLNAQRLHADQGSSRLSEFHRREVTKMATGFVDALSEEEAVELFGSRYNFYLQMSTRSMAHERAKELLRREPKPADLSHVFRLFHAHLASLSHGHASKICLFGMGKVGKQAYQELTDRAVRVNCFCDNDASKHGTTYGTAPCISVDELLAMKDDTLVIATVGKPFMSELLEQLRGLKLPFVCAREDWRSEMLKTPVLP